MRIRFPTLQPICVLFTFSFFAYMKVEKLYPCLYLILSGLFDISFFKLQLSYNIVLVSGVQHNGLGVLQIIFHYRLL